MGFLRRLVEEGTKQINETVNKKLQEAIEKLEKQAKKDGLHQGSSSSSSSSSPTPNYNNSFNPPYNHSPPPNNTYEHQNYNADRISQKQQLSNLRAQLADDQIRRAEQNIDMLGTIGTNQNYVLKVERSKPSNYSSTPPRGVSQKQHLSNLRAQLAHDQIRRYEENSLMMNTIGTNTRIEWVDGPDGGVGRI